MRIKNKYHAIFEQLAILYHKKNLFNSSAAGVTLFYDLLFPPYYKCAENEAWKNSWTINNLLEVPVCCIMEYFYLSFVLYFYSSFVLYFYSSFVLYSYSSFVLYSYSSFVLYFYSSFVLYFYSSFVLYFVSPCRQLSNYGTTRKKILSDTKPKRLTRFSYFLFVIYPSI